MSMVMLGAACTPGGAGTAGPSVAIIPIVLREAPQNLGCDSIPPPYRSATIRIDAAAAEQVWAEADTGARLEVLWSRGFIGGSSAEPAVADPAGRIVARDGERLVLPKAAWPRLGGYFVCPSTTALYVLLRDLE